MTRLERVLASRLLDDVAERYSNHTCNDMPEEYFEDMQPSDLKALEKSFNAWSRGNSFCEEYIPFQEIEDWAWMKYLAAVLGS